MFARRDFLLSCAVGAGSGWLGSAAAGAADGAQVVTFTYKRVGNVAIKADVHRVDTPSASPVAVWIHGGALINGHREGINRRVLEGLLARRYAVISIDYRLAPETKLPEIIADVEDAFRWIRRDAARLAQLDTTRLAVLGGSAGGYLTLAAGYRVTPRPTVLISFWGYGDLIGDWYSKPSPHPRHHSVQLTREEAYRQIAGPPISDSRDRRGNGGAFYQYCRQLGIWPREVSGWDPETEPEKFHAYMPVKNVTADYPPTLLIHGTADTDVPFEQSVMMAERFEASGVAHELISIPAGEHGLSGGDPRLIDDAYERAFAMVDRHMRG